MPFSFKAMWEYQCPRCRHGSIFKEPFDFSKPLDMPEKCIHCGQRMEPEPGFYFGAMFISYIISSILLLIPTLLLVFYYGWSEGSAMGVAILFAAIFYLKFLRGSRSLWLHLMVRHRPDIESKVRDGLVEKKSQPWKPNRK